MQTARCVEGATEVAFCRSHRGMRVTMRVLFVLLTQSRLWCRGCEQLQLQKSRRVEWSKNDAGSGRDLDLLAWRLLR